MNYWILTDTHLGHARIKDYCQRPDGFEERIFENLGCVQKDDVLIHLGDICFRDDEYWHLRLMTSCEGRKWLVKGNHDNQDAAWYLNNGWDFVADEIGLEIHDKMILFSHKPVFDLYHYDFNIHGHYHNNLHRNEDKKRTKKHLLIMLEHEYKPLSLTEILDNVRRR